MDESEPQNIKVSKVEMESPIKKYFFTVTLLSKYLAIILFIVLPFAGFFAGLHYGKSINSKNSLEPNSLVSEVSSNKQITETNSEVPGTNEVEVINKNVETGEMIFSGVVSGAGLPQVTLSANNVVQQGVPGSYCWNRICADGIVFDLPEQEPLQVSQGVLISFDIKTREKPDSVSIIIRSPVKSLQEWPNNPSSITKERILIDPNLKGNFEISVPPGIYILSLSANWKDGDLSTAFRIEVK